MYVCMYGMYVSKYACMHVCRYICMHVLTYVLSYVCQQLFINVTQKVWSIRTVFSTTAIVCMVCIYLSMCLHVCVEYMYSVNDKSSCNVVFLSEGRRISKGAAGFTKHVPISTNKIIRLISFKTLLFNKSALCTGTAPLLNTTALVHD